MQNAIDELAELVSKLSLTFQATYILTENFVVRHIDRQFNNTFILFDEKEIFCSIFSCDSFLYHASLYVYCPLVTKHAPQEEPQMYA